MRTEQDVLMDFEKLGWKVAEGYINFTLEKRKTDYSIFGEISWYCYITFDKDKQTYRIMPNFRYSTRDTELSMQEHKLLNELFRIWGWI